MHLITRSVSNPPSHLGVCPLGVDRQTLAKRRWRAQSDDGLDFGFDLSEPLHHGDVFFVTATHRYQIVQRAETVLAIRLTKPDAAARVGWQIGNLHFPVAFEGEFILAEDDSAIRQLLAREKIQFQERLAVFAPLAPAALTGHAHHHHHH